MISSSSFKSCSDISLAVLEVTSRWIASLASLSKTNGSFLKLLIVFRQTDKSFGVKRETSWSVLLTGYIKFDSLKNYFFCFTHVILVTFKFWFNFLYLSIVWTKDLIVTKPNRNREDCWYVNLVQEIDVQPSGYCLATCNECTVFPQILTAS